mmetsp:Transcript_139859/g.389759  ORF Transcript_139859/g.389759 Transcript_139859/m.389759 type:complete len:143 (-) Transcript_139859:249-677(-)
MGGVTSMCCNQNGVCQFEDKLNSMRKDLPQGTFDPAYIERGTVGPAPPAASSLGRTADEYAITLDKSQGLRLGIDVDHQDGVSLLIETINGGLVEAWNKANPEVAVRQGDRIVEVNNVRDDVLSLVDECKQDKVLHMRLRRA